MSQSYPTRTLARLIGPSLVVMALAEGIHVDIWSNNTPPVVFFNGNVLFVAGLAIVQAHNYWALRPPVLVTLIGWSSLSLGLSRMFFPHQKPYIQTNSPWKTVFRIGALCLVGSSVAAIGYI
uniref:Uncharacterized protein n=1 Tax=Bionectria ochroleuca TaxID=29856 RepID=A0A8H7NDT2_BIOOC